MGWLTGWSYRKSHVVNYAAGAGTNYQVKIVVHYGSGTDSGSDVYLNSHCRTDFGDVRFTDNDGTTLLDFWIESKTDGNNAVFWVEVADDLSTANATIYIYYGKSDAITTSQGDNVFDRFDDFNFDPIATDGRFYGYSTQYNTPLSTGFQWINPQAFRRVSGSIDRTYVAYSRKSGTAFHVMVTYFDHNTKTWATAVQVATLYDGDGHRNAAIIVDSNGYIIIAYGGSESNLYCKKSTNPDDISTWDATVTVQNAGTDVAGSVNGATYPSLLFYGSALYCFFRYTVSTTYKKTYGYKTSSYPYTSWSSFTTVIDFGESYNTYAMAKTSPNGYIHVACSYYENTGVTWKNVYYMYYDGTNWKKKDGTTITLPASLSTIDLAYTSTSTTEYIWDIAFDSNSNPYLATRDGGDYKFIKWTGSAWTSYTITTSGDTGALGNGFMDAIALYMPSTSNFKAYLVKGGTAGKDGGELQEWTSTDGGGTWSKTKDITKESETGTNLVWRAHNFPRIAVNAKAEDLLFISSFGDTDGEVHVYGWGTGAQIQSKFQILRHENLIERYSSTGGELYHRNSRIEIETDAASEEQHLVFSDSLPTNIRRARIRMQGETLGTDYRIVPLSFAWQTTGLEAGNRHALLLLWYSSGLALYRTQTNGGTATSSILTTTTPIAGAWYIVEMWHSGTTTHVKVVKESDGSTIYDGDTTTYDFSTATLYANFGQYCGSTPTLTRGFFEDVYYKKYISPEPAHGSWGSEESSAYTITGITRDANGTPLGTCTVWLFRTSDKAFIAETTSDSNGNYSFSVSDNTTQYFVRAFKDGTPNVFGTTDKNLVGS